jgi:putative oxidoreductase
MRSFKGGSMSHARTRAETVLLVQRMLLSILITAHGWARLLSGAVEPFGIWLTGLDFPFGLAIAYGITGIEILGTPMLALGRFIVPLCLLYSCIYILGIVLVHAPEGWFVVGLGRNGMEYSVLLVVCLLGLAYQHMPQRNLEGA